MWEIFITAYLISVVYNFIKYADTFRYSYIWVVCGFYFLCFFWPIFVSISWLIKMKWAIEDNYNGVGYDKR
jgi:hypothetical protein